MPERVMLEAKWTEEPIVTDGSAWRQPGLGGPTSPGGWPAPTQAAAGRPQAQYGRPAWGAPPAPQPAPDSWWSDALADPWRDPDAPGVVVKTPADEVPPREKPPAPSPGPRL